MVKNKEEEVKQEQIDTEINTDKKIDKTLENDYTTLINLQEYQKIFLELIEKFSNLTEFDNKFFENIVTYMRTYIYEKEDYDLIFKKIWEIIIRNRKESIIKRCIEIIQIFLNTDNINLLSSKNSLNINLINEGITEIKDTFIIHLILVNEIQIEGKEEFIYIKTN